jgi:iron(II)-dependent oxidoreductase
MGVTVACKADVADALAGARARTTALLAPLDDASLTAQASPLMSPLVWDLAHIAHYEELWLLREITGAAPTDDLFDDVYDAFRHPRSERPTLPILGPAEARRYGADVRARVLDVLAGIDLDPARPLLRDGFVYGMVAQHEHQHDETMLATLQLMDGFAHPDAAGWHPPAVGEAGDGVLAVTGGRYALGSERPWVLDNERPVHEVRVEPFRIRRAPVTNREYAAFVAAGGYDDERLWTPAGWTWRNEAGLVAPQFWAREASGSWSRRRFGRDEDLPPDEPVQHVCWYEADAFARWGGARLPTETEWEVAAGVADATGSPFAGGVWEWTASDFDGYPGFEAFPYREYSEVFFGPDYKVLRGGSWAVHPLVHRRSFRNWDHPIRRQIFSGFRCAEDA